MEKRYGRYLTCAHCGEKIKNEAMCLALEEWTKVLCASCADVYEEFEEVFGE